MASVEQSIEDQVEERAADTAFASPEPAANPPIEVENPATGEIITSVPDLTAAEVRELAIKGRAAQPGWEALGFEGRGRVLLRAQKWLIDNADRVIATIVSETGKTYEDAQLAEISYGAGAFGFWAKNAQKFLADERVKTSNVIVKGKKLVSRHAPMGLIGIIGPSSSCSRATAPRSADCPPGRTAASRSRPGARGRRRGRPRRRRTPG